MAGNVSYMKWMLRGMLFAFVSVLMATLLLIFAYKWVNPTTTWLMVQRYFIDDKTQRVSPSRQWVSIDRISPNLVLSVVTAEDNLFMEHYGFDFEAIRKAKQDNSRGKRVRGASTISMQTAKNVFLWPTRSWVRKGLEAGFTILIETFWSKQRIMEVYLNVAEFGRSIYGAEAASQLYFKKKSEALNRSQAALLAAVLPNPLSRNVATPSVNLKSSQQRILRNMFSIGSVDLTETPRKEVKK